MTTDKTRISQLKEMIQLEEKRALLISQLDEVEAKLGEHQSALYGVSGSLRTASARRAAGAKVGPAIRGGRRGDLRNRIFEALQAAGVNGVKVRELAALLNTKAANVHSWFSINAKKTPGLKKIGSAHYALNGKAPAKAPAKAAKAPAAKAPVAKPRKTAKATKAAKVSAKKTAKPETKAVKSTGRIKGPAKRGELKTRILEELKKGGTAGVTIKDLSDKLGVKYKNLYIWFVTTGKRIPGIEKAGPACYRIKG